MRKKLQNGLQEAFDPQKPKVYVRTLLEFLLERRREQGASKALPPEIVPTCKQCNALLITSAPIVVNAAGEICCMYHAIDYVKGKREEFGLSPEEDVDEPQIKELLQPIDGFTDTIFKNIKPRASLCSQP